MKRTYGPVRGAVLIIGDTSLGETLTPARVAEGLADTLALASRHEGPVICMFGTSGLKSPALAEWLAGTPNGVLVHSDRDSPKDGLPPGGRRAAATLWLAIRDAGGTAEIVPPPRGWASRTLRTRRPLGRTSPCCRRSGRATPGRWPRCIPIGRAPRSPEFPL